MTDEQLEKAVHLKEKIDELNSFIFLASRNGFWEKVAFKKEFRLFTNVHGLDEDKGYRLSKDLTKKVLRVFKEQVEEWKKELDRI